MFDILLLTTLFNKSCDPAVKSIARLNEIVEATFKKEGCVDFTEELRTIGVDLAERDMLYDALRLIELKERRKKAGIKTGDPCFAALKELGKCLELETERKDTRSCNNDAVKKGLLLLKESGQVLDPELENRLAPYGLRAGYMYTEGNKAAWVPFFWDMDNRTERKVHSLRMDFVTKDKSVVKCSPLFFMDKASDCDSEKGKRRMIKNTTDYLLKNLGVYKPRELSNKLKVILDTFYETDAVITNHGLKDGQNADLGSVRLLGFYVSTNKNKRVSHVYFLKNDVSVGYKLSGAMVKMLFANATNVSQSRKRPRET